MVAVEHYPRRLLLLSCGFLNMSALMLFVLSAQLQNIWDACNFALGPISWFITAELVPLQYRALCQSLALSSNQAIALILCFITLPLYDKIGSLVLLPLFVIPGLAAMFYLLLYLPETRSRNIDEVILELKGGIKSSAEPSPQTAQT
ncbi:hypothetical protein COOONC_21076 [Cooperia oncophora]